MRRLLASLAVLAGMLTPAGAAVLQAAPAAHAAVTESPGARALDWAEYHAAGRWYCWGGAGPSCWDCSGLVMDAAWHADGIALPHSTYAMPSSWHLVRTYAPQRGDLAFYGPGHVEFVTAWYHATFGAHHSGSRIGWITWGPWWHPTMFFRLR